MSILDATSVGDHVRMVPPRNADLIPIRALTDGSGDVTSIDGYSTGEVPVTRSGGQYTFNVGYFTVLLALEAAASLEGASQTYAKFGEDSIRVTYPAAVTSGYISFNAYVHREIS
jgi:hypothetical protein